MIFCANPSAQFRTYQDQIEESVLKVLRGNRYILGEEVEALEQEFAIYIGTKHAIGVANGTDAIEISLRAIELNAGDEVITVSHTAVATVAAIEAAGGTPVLVDVDPVFFTLEPSQLEEVLTTKTRAVIAVHLYGQAADLGPIIDFCERHNLVLIEDVSQAHGANWHGRRLGSIGHVGCFSCYPTKNLGAIGDAGLITTNNEQISNKIRSIREYGWKDRYISEIKGKNSRLDEIQAAVLRVKLRHLDEDNAKRIKIADKYSEILRGIIKTPQTRDGSSHVFHLYVVQSKLRKELITYLEKNKIQVGIHYPLPIHLQPAYKSSIRKAHSMVVTEKLSSEVMSLPIYPELTIESACMVANILRKSDFIGSED